jgi:hypothetical protein
MEATAMYLAHPSAAGNIQRVLPQVSRHTIKQQQHKQLSYCYSHWVAAWRCWLLGFAVIMQGPQAADGELGHTVNSNGTAAYRAFWVTLHHVLLLQVRMVALLREPVSRALSSVNMLFQRSPEYTHLKPQTPEYNNAWQAYVVTELRRWDLAARAC